MATTATQQRAHKKKIDEARHQIYLLFEKFIEKEVTWDEYCLLRLPYLEILGTRSLYDETGQRKSAEVA